MGPIVASLREANKLKTTIKKWIDGADAYEVVHAGFNLTGTRTSRLSCSKPNLQNIASKYRTKETQRSYSGDAFERTDEYNLRIGFRARPGRKFVAVDWSQMEMRMFGILSQDPFMLKTLLAGGDVHGDIAEQVWGTRDGLHREWSKTISFGLLYGMTTGTLMHRLGMTARQARQVSEDYWTTFPTIQPWLNERIDECRTFGFVRYWSGRIWRQHNPALYYRSANAVIQGGCADILSLAAIRVDDMLLQDYGGDPYIWNFVHDELIVEADEADAIGVCNKMVSIMQMEDLFDVPWKVSAKIGDTYGTLEEDITGAEY
jgi:DNA polymerase-1